MIQPARALSRPVFYVLTNKLTRIQLNAIDITEGIAMESQEIANELTQSNALSSIQEKLEAIERHLVCWQSPKTWSVEDIGEWLGLSKFTTSQRVVTRPGFPEPIIPAGVQGAQKRWFADEVIEWFRQNRGALPKARPGKRRGRPRNNVGISNS
jgi:hypothetical protein